MSLSRRGSVTIRAAEGPALVQPERRDAEPMNNDFSERGLSGAEHEVVASLLGVWAVDACTREETRLVLDHLVRCVSCAEESVRLGGAADLLSSDPGPPARLRTRVLERAMERRPPTPKVPEFAAPYAAQVSVLNLLLAELDESEWAVPVLDEYGWNVQDLIAHLAATDGLLAARLGLPGGSPDRTPPGGGDDVDARTAAVVAHHRRRPAAVTRTVWFDQAMELCAYFRTNGFGRGASSDPRSALESRSISLGGWSQTVGTAILTRAFETWIHASDIAAALGRAAPMPLPGDIHRMGRFGVALLPVALALNGGRPRPDTSVRVVLTGAGGGDYLVSLDPALQEPALPGGPGSAGEGVTVWTDTAVAPTTTLQLDVVDFCFLTGGRRDPGRISVRLTGEAELGRELLAAAPALSGP